MVSDEEVGEKYGEWRKRRKMFPPQKIISTLK
jgi:hypothetical protein